jgi:N-dimethylarginine dimethylaminohydrolase
MAKILMCSPEFYGIEYSINPWMDVKNKSEWNLSVKQWGDLVSILKEVISAEVIVMNGVEKLPDIVFTANAGIYISDNYLRPDGKDSGQVYLSNFRHPERQPEREHYSKFLTEKGYTCVKFPDDIYFEGAGDCLVFGGETYCGYGFRSDIGAYDYFPGKKCILKLKDAHFYHLDTCFCPLPRGVALIYPPAFEDISNIKLKLLAVPEDEAKKFACNAVCIDNNVVIPSGCPTTRKLLEDHGFKVYDTDMSEFIKAGGACKCLTLRLD